MQHGPLLLVLVTSVNSKFEYHLCYNYDDERTRAGGLDMAKATLDVAIRQRGIILHTPAQNHMQSRARAASACIAIGSAGWRL